MVASRKPRPNKRGERRPGETLEAMYERVTRSETPPDGFAFSVDEARYILRRMSDRPRDPHALPGDEIVKRSYGLWPDPVSGDYPE